MKQDRFITERKFSTFLLFFDKRHYICISFINKYLSYMKNKTFKNEAVYTAPVTVFIETPSEGVLCASYGNEEFGGAENYGEGLDNKGWY